MSMGKVKLEVTRNRAEARLILVIDANKFEDAIDQKEYEIETMLSDKYGVHAAVSISEEDVLHYIRDKLGIEVHLYVDDSTVSKYRFEMRVPLSELYSYVEYAKEEFYEDVEEAFYEALELISDEIIERVERSVE